MQFVWRVRLERAARQLVFDRQTSITRIAHQCGFASSQAFAQSFRARFDVSPRAYRENPALPKSQLPIEDVSDAAFIGAVNVNTQPAQRVAYIRNFGPYDRITGAIPQAFQALTSWAYGLGLPAKALPKIGICPDNRRVTPDPVCLYDCCIPVPDDVNEDTLVSIQTIPAGVYAEADVSCSNAQVLKAWESLTAYGRSLPGRYNQCWSYEVFHPTPTGTPNPNDGLRLCLRLG